MKDLFATAQAADFAGVRHDAVTETNKGHGRVQRRPDFVTENLQTLPRRAKWKGLHRFGMAVREPWEGNRGTEEQRYFIASVTTDTKSFAGAVHQHWDIENRLHRRLDVVFSEDASTLRKGMILATLRDGVLNLIEREGSSTGLAAKRRRAAWDDDYRAILLLAKLS